MVLLGLIVKITTFYSIFFQEMFEIAPCSQPWIDIVTDSLFEYSLLVNLLLIGTCVGCTRWVLVPWLVLYAINIVLLGLDCVISTGANDEFIVEV